ncbi:MAG: deoxyribonuclease IV, partial [Candidatus Omnitrophica bacterium]|nr:deoxyribonuclease IV [Candidatus Omnitrophota bacterium]
LGCNTMQIFARNPRQFRKASLDEEDVRIFKEKVKKEKINPVVIHIPYTLNLASAKQKVYESSIREFIADLIEADKLDAQYLITHMGSYKGSTEKKGLLKISKAISEILKETKGIKTTVLLENTSGSGNWLGYKFSHHRFILENVGWHQKIGLCLDTAHAWAAGYKINDCQGVDSLVKEIEEEAGIERLKVVHLNDTKEGLGSRHDRHFAIGQGNIGKNGFYFILHHRHLKNLPFILETPKKSDEDDIKNLDTARKLYLDQR